MLLSDAYLRQKLAENSRRLAEPAYDWKVMLKQLDPIYEYIVRQGAVKAFLHK
jgi:glycosyltransferase involved in cell wall biosynthesis